MTDQRREPDPSSDQQPIEATRSKVAIWLTYKGDRRWSLSIDVGTPRHEVDEAIHNAIEGARRLETER